VISMYDSYLANISHD